MNSAKLNDWLQVLGLFGVMASLVFVGLEMKQNREIALAQTYSTRAAISVDTDVGLIGSPEFLSATAKLYSGLRDQLTAEEYVAMESANGAFLTVMENLHYQYQLGFLPEAHWKKNLAELECRLSEPFFRALIVEWQGREDFLAILKDISARSEATEESCWESWESDPWPYFHPVEQ